MSAMEYSPATIGAIRQLLVEHAVEPVGLVGVAVDGVGHLFGRIDAEMVGLSEHRAEAAHLPEQPLVHLHAPALVGRIEATGLAAEILQDGAGFEDRDRLAVRPVGIDDGRHLVVGRDRQELGLELVALADIDRMHGVRQAGLLEHDGDLPSVRGRPVIEVDRMLGGNRHSMSLLADWGTCGSSLGQSAPHDTPTSRNRRMCSGRGASARIVDVVHRPRAAPCMFQCFI